MSDGFRIPSCPLPPSNIPLTLSPLSTSLSLQSSNRGECIVVKVDPMDNRRAAGQRNNSQHVTRSESAYPMTGIPTTHSSHSPYTQATRTTSPSASSSDGTVTNRDTMFTDPFSDPDKAHQTTNEYDPYEAYKGYNYDPGYNVVPHTVPSGTTPTPSRSDFWPRPPVRRQSTFSIKRRLHLFSSFEPPPLQHLLLHTLLCGLTYPWLIITTLAASGQTLFFARFFVGAGCGIIAFALGLSLTQFAKQQFQACSELYSHPCLTVITIYFQRRNVFGLFLDTLMVILTYFDCA